MSAKIFYLKGLVIISLLSFLLLQCTKENFTEPVDPFEVERLEPDPNIYQLGQGENALTLKTNKDNIFETERGVRIKGSVFIENPIYGDIRITSGDFELVKEDETFYSDFLGFGLSELPREGMLQNLNMLELSGTPIGFQIGSAFDTGNFNWPLNPNRYYFYYSEGDVFGAEILNTKIEGITKLAIDPLDPLFYVSCDFNGTPIGDIENVGLGISAQGLIPFNPLVREYNIPDFYGHIYLSGKIPIYKYPAAFAGETVIAFNTNSGPDTDNFFSGNQTNYQMGLNGQVTFEHEALDWLNIEVVLGQASLYLAVEESGDSEIMFVGVRQDPPITVSDFVNQVVGQDWNFLDYLNISEVQEIFYGRIGTELSNWEIGFKMNSHLNILGHSIEMGRCHLALTPNSLYFSGVMPIAVFSSIGVDGYANTNGNFSLTGYARTGFDFSCCSLSFDCGIKVNLTLEHTDGVFKIRGSGKIWGEVCWGKICADFSLSPSFEISSDGSIELCFSIGIGKWGWDICKSWGKVGNTYVETTICNEIPLSQVPIENRFEIKQ